MLEEIKEEWKKDWIILERGDIFEVDDILTFKEVQKSFIRAVKKGDNKKIQDLFFEYEDLFQNLELTMEFVKTTERVDQAMDVKT